MAERLHVHALDVDELADPVSRTLAAVARMLDPAEWHSRIRPHVLVDEAHAGFELFGGDAPAAVDIAGEDSRAEPELAGVGDPDGVALVIRGDDRSDRSEHFLVVRRLARMDVGEHRRRVPGA